MSEKLPVKLSTGKKKTHGGWSYLATGKLPEHRREIERFLSAARQGLIEDIAGDEESLTTAQAILIGRIVSKLGVIRCVEEYIRENTVMIGARLSPSLRESYLAYNNSIRLDLAALGIDKKRAGDFDLPAYVKAYDEQKEAEGKTKEKRRHGNL